MEYLRICDIGKVITGKTPNTECLEYYDGLYPFITPTDIKTFNERYINETERTISELGLQKVKSCILSKDSICFVCIGSTIGKMCLVKQKSISNQQINSIIVNQQFNPKYIFYNLRFNKGYFQLIGGGTGSGKGIVKKSTFEKIKLPIISPIEIQDKIALVLSKYDDLIENNNERIKLLEQMSEELYKEWFVRFRFHGYDNVKFKDSELGKIPEFFKVLKPKDIFDYYIGGGWGNDDYSDTFPINAYVIRGADFPEIIKSDVSTCPNRYHKVSNYTSRKLQENDIVFEISGGTAEQPVGRTVLITKGILSQLNNKVICASFCKLIRPNYNKVSPLYLYHWFKFLYDTRMIERFQLQSTGIINFKFEYFLKKGPILVPPSDLMIEFEKMVKPMREEIDKLAIKNSLLKQQRDSLLPRLMSGKIDLEDKEVI